MQRGRRALQCGEGRADAARFQSGDRRLTRSHRFGELALARPGPLACVTNLLADAIASDAAAYSRSNVARPAAALASRFFFTSLIVVRAISRPPSATHPQRCGAVATRARSTSCRSFIRCLRNTISSTIRCTSAKKNVMRHAARARSKRSSTDLRRARARPTSACVASLGEPVDMRENQGKKGNDRDRVQPCLDLDGELQDHRGGCRWRCWARAALRRAYRSGPQVVDGPRCWCRRRTASAAPTIVTRTAPSTTPRAIPPHGVPLPAGLG